MHVALVFPAATDPRSPHLSLASLAAALRADGVRVSLHDLDVEGMHHVLASDRLAAAAEALTTSGAGDDPARRRLLANADWLVHGTAGALDDLRRPDAFLDPDRHHQARTTVDLALALAASTRPGVTYKISGADYAVDGVDTARLSHLLDVTADDRHDLFEDLHADLRAAFAADRPDLVGISILNRQQVIPGLTLARRLKEDGHLVVLGGTVYAKFHDSLLTRPSFFEAFGHALVPYEGETALRGLVEAVAAGRPPTAWGDVANVLSLDAGGRVVAGPTHAEDIRSLPTPDFTGMPLDRYLSPVPVLPILTGKGCYFNRCKFCDIPFINRIADKPYRVRSAEQIAGDVATLHARHGARHFEITDETLSPTLMLRIADALEPHRHIEPRFVGYARFEPGFTPENCERLHAMGFRKLFFGLESGNQQVLDHMDKGIKVGRAHEVLQRCADAGIATHTFCIVGFPEETEAQARDTLQFLLDAAPALAHPRNSFDVHPFGLDLRTEYGDQPERFGVELAPVDPATAADTAFPITLRGWRNTRGLSAEDVARLIDEFSEALRRQYAGLRAYPEQQWPGYEEYAVVYGDHYDGRAFGWRLALPAAGSPERFQLRFADHVRFGAHDAGTLVHSLAGDLLANRTAVVVLRQDRPPLAVDDLLDALIDAVPAFAGAAPDRRAELADQLRATVDDLLEARALWLVPDHAAVRWRGASEPAVAGAEAAVG